MTTERKNSGQSFKSIIKTTEPRANLRSTPTELSFSTVTVSIAKNLNLCLYSMYAVVNNTADWAIKLEICNRLHCIKSKLYLAK
jgi:hypothetical protein